LKAYTSEKCISYQYYLKGEEMQGSMAISLVKKQQCLTMVRPISR